MRYFETTTTTTGGQTEFALAATSHGDLLGIHMNERTWLNRVAETRKKRRLKKLKLERNRGEWNGSSSRHGQSE